MEYQKNVTEQTNSKTDWTEEAWIFSGPAPAKDDRIEVPMTLIVSKSLWENFMQLCQSDEELAKIFVSAYTGTLLQDCDGKSIGYNDMVCEFIREIATDKKLERQAA